LSWRQIHDSVAYSNSLARLTDAAERLFWRLLAQTDAWGRLPGEPSKVRALCVPTLGWSDEYIADLLHELEREERIAIYGLAKPEDDVGSTPNIVGSGANTFGNREYILMRDFDEHQPRSARRRGRSKFPDPPFPLQTTTPNHVDTTPNIVGSAPNYVGSTPPERERERERERREERKAVRKTSSLAHSESLTAQPFVVLPRRRIDPSRSPAPGSLERAGGEDPRGTRRCRRDRRGAPHGHHPDDRARPPDLRPHRHRPRGRRRNQRPSPRSTTRCCRPSPTTGQARNEAGAEGQGRPLRAGLPYRSSTRRSGTRCSNAATVTTSARPTRRSAWPAGTARHEEGAAAQLRDVRPDTKLDRPSLLTSEGARPPQRTNLHDLRLHHRRERPRSLASVQAAIGRAT
jgi:hypothetical protein